MAARGNDHLLTIWLSLMTVKDIFELRKRGQVEAAYEAIRPIYAAHKGRYTTLCMFWVASDVFKLRVEQGRIEEAEKIYSALKRLVPLLEEYDRQGTSEREATLRQAQGPQGQGPWALRRAQGPQAHQPWFDPSTLRQAQGPQGSGTVGRLL